GLFLREVALLAMNEDRQLIRPLQELQRHPGRAGRMADHADAQAGHLVSIAIGAVIDAARIEVRDVGNAGDEIAHAVSENDAARAKRTGRRRKAELISAPLDPFDRAIADLHAGRFGFLAPAAAKLRRRNVVLSDEAVNRAR